MEKIPEAQYFVALYETAKIVNSSLKLDEVLDNIVGRAAHCLNSKAASIRLLNRAGDQLLIRAAHGLPDEYRQKGPVHLDRSEIDREAMQGRPICVCDMGEEVRLQYQEQARAEGLCVVLCVPLMAYETVVGLLRVYAQEQREYTDPELHLVQALADLGAVAIQNARQHEQLATDYQYLVNYVQGVPA